MYQPLSTYRIQFHKDFTLAHLEEIIPYLVDLGVHTLYASPIFQAVPGSTHGYDGTNPWRVNPEIGTEADLRRCAAKLRQHGIGWLQDIVPNHMAFHPDNAWLMDVLRKGKNSPYASFFDIGWENGVYGGKLMVPFLGGKPEEEIEANNLKIGYKNGEPVLQHYDSSYPLNADSQNKIISHFNLASQDAIDAALEQLNSDKELIKQLVSQQYYQLCHWQETDKQINFRRFFTINGLICLNIQNRHVFDQYHQYIRQLIGEDVFQGLRIDHIDGLYDPAMYLSTLQESMGGDVYTVVEKILQPGEDIPSSWQVQGNTGYDFLAMVSNLFTNQDNEKAFTRFYHSFTGDDDPVHEQILQKKSAILYDHMGGELDNLYQLLLQVEPTAAEQPSEKMKQAIGALLIYCPVYRYYGSRLPLKEEEAKAVNNILNRAAKGEPKLEDAIKVLRQTLLEKPQEGDVDYNQKAAHFYRRCMQFSGPLTAKGVEDTLMYTYARFIGHNDVGDAPEAFGISKEDFHRMMKERQERWPLSINTTSTHDTKRGEDVRARLTVLTDMPEEWTALVKAWHKAAKPQLKSGAPDKVDEYFLYQTILGALPMPGEGHDDFGNRIDAYIEKFLREAKRHSGWATPNEQYEEWTKVFAASLLKEDSDFRKSFAAFHKQVADFGIINSLSQLILKFTCPGVPDVYQGTELWDLSLVDPDNRRAVDYSKRKEIIDGTDTLEDLWQRRSDGEVKASLTQQLLKLRKEYAQVFTDGQYIPLKTAGRYADYVFAFARRYGKTWIVTAIPLNLPSLCKKQGKPVNEIDWKDTYIILPPHAPEELQSLILAGETNKVKDGILIQNIFKTLPFALLKLHAPTNERGAGILLALSSLPSAFGIGDMGQEAHNFLRFLSRAGQTYWQLLPLNPTEAGAGHSPYSSYSATAGNPLIISPEALVEDGLLLQKEVDDAKLPYAEKADYEAATNMKKQLFEKAFNRFSEGDNSKLNAAFEIFCKKEAAWLDDVALYVTIRQHFINEPWYRWDAPYKNRDEETLQRFAASHAEDILRYKWLQFMFSRQWASLKQAAASYGISLFGDIPFYVSYDSVDVWAHRDIFSIDGDGVMTGIAGVPPDYFSEDGQLWGMPTFNWDVLKEQNYGWWASRLRRNLELFDLIRIDHFRAFQDYWKVPAGATTAKTGEWLPGPRDEFFTAMKEQLGSLPFVAEDLGDEMDAVYVLRERLGLPGMKVLQFAWGDNMPNSVDVPHNHEVNSIVYTGTHDNNTTIGWYSEDAAYADHKRMRQYLGLKPQNSNIHEVMGRLAYSSIARLAILPMQDVLGLDASARMNTPGQATDNWTWRMKHGVPDDKLAKKLREWAELFDRR